MKLTIRTANQEFGDLDIECPETMVVRELKAKLCEGHPAHPCISEQRLICSGRLLSDESLLKDCLIDYGNMASFIVHLVCKSRFDRQGSKNTAKPGSTQPSPPFLPQSAQSLGGPFTTVYPWSVSQPTSLTASNTNPSIPQTMEAQYAAWMQAYSYYTYTYFQSLQNTPNQGHNAIYPLFPGVVPSSSTIQNPQPPQPEINNENRENEFRQRRVADQIPEAPPRLQNANVGLDAGLVGAAQIGAANNDEEAVRDWLDWMYTLTRLGILVCFAALHSSTPRIMLVILLGLAVYLYQTRRAQRPNRVPEPNPRVEPPPAPEREDDNNNRNEPNPDQVNNNIPQGMENNPELRQEAAVPPPRPPTALDVVKTALVSFVTSLFPDHQNIFN
ncbi:homocysteine-responsive endoplasmic reticulum-resident ubiquitin-like domain member 2 protein [Artemia franciscana]|uniref:Ubiquitin-like domain-containing protein n=1 Tax=Artemia franciscana TaxID=6661 RepID=A0AA88HH05_ARTSF|nr:hypothetical protein QYM36_014422 [Artemia franciscana]